MEFLDIIYQRRSIREFTDATIEKEKMIEIIRAGMAAPSSENEQPWHFVVVDDREVLKEMSDFMWAAPVLKKCTCAIIVCADIENINNPDDGWWIQDCSATTQNMLLETEYQGLGGVWIGVYPEKDFVDSMVKVLGTPEKVIPFAIVAIGHKAVLKEPIKRYYSDRVWRNGWSKEFGI